MAAWIARTEKVPVSHHEVAALWRRAGLKPGEVFGRCTPGRDGVAFLAFLKRAVAPHRGKEIHVVLDNLATHTTPEVQDWLADHPLVHFHFTPIGSSWLNQIETWFSITTRQSIRRGTFSSARPRA